MEALLSFVIAIGIVTVIIGGGVFISLFRARRKQRQQEASGAYRLLHDDEWDFVVDGRVVASLKPAGPPEDLNTSFITFEVNVIPGCEDEVKRLLFDLSERNPEDEHISFRSRTREGEALKDSQVLGGRAGEGRVNLKAYPMAEQHVGSQGSSRPAT